MLWTIAVILLVLWLVGWLGLHLLGGAIHILVILAVIAVVMALVERLVAPKYTAMAAVLGLIAGVALVVVERATRRCQQPCRVKHVIESIAQRQERVARERHAS